LIVSHPTVCQLSARESGTVLRSACRQHQVLVLELGDDLPTANDFPQGLGQSSRWIHLIDSHVEHLGVIANSLVRRRKIKDEARGIDVEVALIDSDRAKRGVTERITIGAQVLSVQIVIEVDVRVARLVAVDDVDVRIAVQAASWPRLQAHKFVAIDDRVPRGEARDVEAGIHINNNPVQHPPNR